MIVQDTLLGYPYFFPWIPRCLLGPVGAWLLGFLGGTPASEASAKRVGRGFL
jgi:hypothetical protein